jgi:hypothetical protein
MWTFTHGLEQGMPHVTIRDDAGKERFHGTLGKALGQLALAMQEIDKLKKIESQAEEWASMRHGSISADNELKKLRALLEVDNDRS